MSFNIIKLKDLMPLREAEEEETKAAEEEGGGENPFAAADSGSEEEGGEEEAPKGGEEGEEEADTKAAKPQQPKHPVKFNINQVKKYNKVNFLSNQGELKSIDKKGVIVTVLPDNVDVFVNFDDIL